MSAVEKMSEEMKEHLLGKIIPFWRSLRDDKNGGWYGYMSYELDVDKNAVKGCILNSRITWFFSNVVQCIRRGLITEADCQIHGYSAEDVRREAQHGYDFLKAHCLDSVNGGIFWALQADGSPEDTTKHTYNQAFCIYALASYYEALEDAEALKTAFGLFELIEEKCTDNVGYLEAFTIDFKPESNEKLSENGVMAAKTMNTLLHVFEAYTELYRVSHHQRVGERLKWILDTFADKLYNAEKHRQEVFFDEYYNPIIDLHSYGHDIETAWLIDRGLEVLGDKAYSDKLSPITKDLTAQIYQLAFNGHSLANECERGVVNTHRIWWVQAETVIGFFNGWQKDKDRTEYLEAALSEWEFIKEFVVDKRNGSEWFWEVDEEGRPYPERPIVEPWKCPYHNGRMCMEIMKRAKEIRKMIHEKYFELAAEQEKLLARKNVVNESFYNGIYDRYCYPVLTREHIPLTWKYDLNKETNPYFMERLGINAVMNSGAIYLNGKYYLIARIEGNDRKSFFGVAESDNGVDGFRFWDYPILLDDTCPEETNVYDMRLTQHEDGYIYGVFCSESKDKSVNDLSAAVAAAGIVRTKDLKHWERLDNLVTLRSPQQRNVVLHPEFVDGRYAFYTRPMDDFIETGSGGGVGFGLCDDITHAVIDEEKMTSLRKYHTITEAKNGAGATPIKTDMGWIHIAHGVRNTAAGLRYVIYAFATDLKDPSRVIAEPSGLLIGPRGEERVGDVSNVVFTNGAIVNEKNEVFLYYASSDTRMHVATTTIDKLKDYVFHTPADPGRSVECVAQRCELIQKNLELLKEELE